MPTIRQIRVAERIREELGNLLLREVQDPGLALVTITDVTIDRELAFAEVYVNALGDEERQTKVLAALQRARGYLRSQIASRIRLRRAPELRFRWDPSLEYGERITRLLDSLGVGGEEEEE